MMPELQGGARPHNRFSKQICVLEPHVRTRIDRSGPEDGNPLQATIEVRYLSPRIMIPNSFQPKAGLET